MQKLYALITVFILSIYTFSQTPNAPVETKSQTDTANLTVGGRVSVPAEKAAPLTIPKITDGPVIDGSLKDEVWKQAAVFKDFYQTEPGYNIAPSKPTEAYMMYDEKNLYIGFKCWDEKDKIRATVAKRDAVFDEDNVRVWLDTYNDRRRAYILGFNPLGIQQDGIFTEDRGADFSVDIVMESKGIIEDWGWSVEVKIPFKSLRYSAGKGKLWGFNVARNIDRFNDEFDQWMPDDRDVSGFLIKHGRIGGFDGIKNERTLELVPSVTLSETGSRKRTLPLSFANNNAYDPIFYPIGVTDPGRFVNDPIKKDLGLNLKYTITPNVTLDAAINPDYAEIEADAPVVTANQRFPIFFEEKRPFFLEGQDVFTTPLVAFYSRTIADPDYAVKLTGKVGKTSFGFLGASDNAPGNYSEDERSDPDVLKRIEPFLDKNAYVGVLRVKRDIGKENSLGFYATARSFPLSHNFLAGFDGKFKLNPRTVLTFQTLGTNSRKNFYDPNTDRVNYRTGNGFAYYLSLDYTAKNYGYFFETFGRTRDYRADAGFTRRVNTNSAFLAGRLSTDPRPKARVISFAWQPFAKIIYNWQGRSQDGLLGNNYQVNLQGNLNLYTEFGVTYQRLFEEEFGARRTDANPTGGAFFGAGERSAYQPYINGNLSKTFNKKLNAGVFLGFEKNAFDLDFGNGFRYGRVSPAFSNYLNSPAYLDYIRTLQTDPNNPNLTFPNAPGLDPGKGRQFDMQIATEYKPINPLRFSLEYTKSRLVRYDTNKTAFDTNIFSLRSTYQFTRFVFTRFRLDYDTLSSGISGQALFGWNPSPGTAFYVGYNDSLNYNGFSQFTNQAEPGLNRNSRTFFIRASYLFRKSF